MSQTIHLNELFRSVPQISCKPSHLIWFSEHKRHGEYCKFYHKNARHKHTKDDEFSFILKRVYCPDDRILALRNNNLKNTFSKFRAEQQKKTRHGKNNPSTIRLTERVCHTIEVELDSTFNTISKHDVNYIKINDLKDFSIRVLIIFS